MLKVLISTLECPLSTSAVRCFATLMDKFQGLCETVEKSDRKTWVIESKKELIGYCMIQFGPEEVHLINMAVEPSFQKMGLGRKLLHHFLDTNAPNTSIFLEVKRGNFPAINLYLNAGFEEITIRQKYYTEGEDAIIMCLKV